MRLRRSYKFVGQTFKNCFVIEGINVFSEKWIQEGSCVAVTNPHNGRQYIFSKYICGEIEFVAGQDSNGYWLFYI